MSKYCRCTAEEWRLIRGQDMHCRPTPLRGFVYMRLIRLRLNVLALRGQPLPQRSKTHGEGVRAARPPALAALALPPYPGKRGTPSGAFGHAHGSRAVYGYGRAKRWCYKLSGVASENGKNRTLSARLLLLLETHCTVVV